LGTPKINWFISSHHLSFFPYSLGIYGVNPHFQTDPFWNFLAWSEALGPLGDDSELDIAGLIESLQGQWEDDVGLSIKVNGNEVASWL